jgi:ATP-dependent exoDNAse (exonuclease V) beta subunit
MRCVEPLVDLAPARLSVASMITCDDEPPVFKRRARTSDLLVGTLVHRLLQHVGFDSIETKPIREVASRLVRAEEADETDDVERVVDMAIDAYRAICARADVRCLYEAGRTLHEVSFTMSLDRRIVRGTADCLVERAPGMLTLLEFKTGRERPEHRQQVELYVQALRQLFPGAVIDAHVVYAPGNFPLPVQKGLEPRK